MGNFIRPERAGCPGAKTAATFNEPPSTEIPSQVGGGLGKWLCGVFPLAARDVTAGDFLYLQRQAASLLAMIFRIVRHRKLLKSCDALKFASFDLALCVCV